MNNKILNNSYFLRRSGLPCKIYLALYKKCVPGFWIWGSFDNHFMYRNNNEKKYNLIKIPLETIKNRDNLAYDYTQLEFQGIPLYINDILMDNFDRCWIIKNYEIKQIVKGLSTSIATVESLFDNEHESMFLHELLEKVKDGKITLTYKGNLGDYKNLMFPEKTKQSKKTKDLHFTFNEVSQQ